MKNLRKKYILLTQCISEFLGTGLIIFISSTCAASSKLTNSLTSSWEISCILGIGTCIAIYASLFISGAHLNPIVTLVFFLLFNFNQKKVIPYIIFQILGSFLASSIVYKLYYNVLIQFECQQKILRGSIESVSSASIFSFFPNKNVSIVKIFILEFIATFIFMSIIISIRKNENFFYFKNILTPIFIGMLVCIINIIISPWTSFTLNPAHDIGSRIFICLLGWGKIAFTGGISMSYFIIPILGTILGSIASVYFYKLYKN
ncbi:MAG: MIP/aquaporin family protein [Buchnera aphidicola (Schlechtendalia peitan)]